jgi:hypothetical protein
MTLIEIPLNRYRYHFRQLKWKETTRIKVTAEEGSRRAVMLTAQVILAAALVDVSGMNITRADARKIFETLPEAVLWKMWVLYQGNLPKERYYTAGGIYTAPEQATHQRTSREEDENTGVAADRAMSEM